MNDPLRHQAASCCIYTLYKYWMKRLLQQEIREIVTLQQGGCKVHHYGELATSKLAVEDSGKG
jgi:hypothetical protein